MSVLIPSARDTVTCGGRVFTNMNSLIILHGFINTAGRHTSLRTANGTASRQTTTGKTMTIYAARLLRYSAGAQINAVLSYGDNDVGTDSAAAPTNVVYMMNTSSYKPLTASAGTAFANVHDGAIAVAFQVPSTKYPAFGADTDNTNIVAYGYEV